MILDRANCAEGQKDGDSYKTGSQFSTHLKKSEGASDFSRGKTLKQQREYLPAFAVREELMGQLRDHQGQSPFNTVIQLLIYR
jgi:pre-mRNA-splicing factor ATP-dependent RNA helicase DHX38/PRP16